MRFEVEVGVKLRTISIKRHGHAFRVEADGRVLLVDARKVGESSLSLLVGGDNGHVPARSVDVALAAREQPGVFDVHVGGRVIPLTIRPAAASGRHNRQVGALHSAGPQRLTAPMPGKIVRVLVKPGDEVAGRQGLVVIEAMKMENELRASRPGRVREVAVSQGQSVDAGSVLVIVD
ncbi:MAG: biotin/lipoyl-containing protein [Vicinamibacterales bacterium]